MPLDLSELNDEQRAAVTHGEGPLLVVSAAGSGKTRVLTYRAAWLLQEGHDPHGIVLCTFTRKAANEMTERVANLAGATVGGIRSGTMHSLFLKILRSESWPWPEFEVLDEYKQKRMLKGILPNTSADDLAEVISTISLWKNELVPPPTTLVPSKYVTHQERLLQTYAWYEEQKRESHVLDFDDFLVETVKLFEAKPDVLERWRPEWLLVDEAQDTSLAQWRALELLAGVVKVNACQTNATTPESKAALNAVVNAAATKLGAPRNITCVADWRQAIYSWRGARPEAILDFEQRFPSARVISLPRNYRSGGLIVDRANALIRHSGKELEDMVPVRIGGRSVVTDATDPDDEADYLASEIAIELKRGRRGGEFAVLYRVNSYSRAFEEALASRRIPYVIIGSTGFFGRREVTDMVSYLRLLTDPNDEEALRRIVNRPTRYLGRAYVDAVVAEAKNTGLTLVQALTDPGGLNARQFRAASAFAWDMRQVSKLPTPGAVIRHIRTDMGYDRWLLREEGSGTADENRIENLDELVSVAARFSDVPAFLTYVDMQLAQSRSDDPDPDKVQLMTIHKAKGLEWPTVFVVGASDGLLPHHRCMEGEAFEEERRLMYVAITRARDELYASTVATRQARPLKASRFLYEAEFLSGQPEAVYESAKALVDEVAP